MTTKIAGDDWTQSSDDYNSVTEVHRNGKLVARFRESYTYSTITVGKKLEFGRGGRRNRKRRAALGRPR